MAIAAPGQLNVNESPIWGSRSVDCFEKLEQIGEGTYGFVSIYLLLKLYVMKNKLFALSLRKWYMKIYEVNGNYACLLCNTLLGLLERFCWARLNLKTT